MSPARQHPVDVSRRNLCEIAAGGVADNISFLVNVTFPSAGHYLVQTLIDSTLFDEQTLTVADEQSARATDNASEAVN